MKGSPVLVKVKPFCADAAGWKLRWRKVSNNATQNFHMDIDTWQCSGLEAA
jgi:hypothetical protein